MDVKSRSDSDIDRQNKTPGGFPNTYRLGPDKVTLFSCLKVKPLVESILVHHLEDYKYDSKTSGDLCKQISDDCKQRIKMCGFNRYKLVTQCLIFSNNNQSVRFASRYLWDERHDNVVSASFNGDGFTAVLMAGAVYAE